MKQISLTLRVYEIFYVTEVLVLGDAVANSTSLRLLLAEALPARRLYVPSMDLSA